jgi:hypothetical protein
MRQLVLIVVKLAISIALLYFAISRMNFSTIMIDSIDVKSLMTAFDCKLRHASSQSATAVPRSAPPNCHRPLRFNLIAAFNQVLPSTVGGDAAHSLARTG